LGRESVEVEVARAVHAARGVGAAAGGQSLDAVDAYPGELRAQAAHGDVAALAALAGDRHAGNALQRLGEVEVGEVGDVLCHDRVDHARFAALDVDRTLEAGAIAGHHHRVQGLRINLRRGSGVLRDRPHHLDLECEPD